MEELEMTGRTVDEAIDKALRQLGAARDDVEVVVVDRGRSGVFGLGAELARVVVTMRPGAKPAGSGADSMDVAKETLETLLRSMGVEASVAIPERSLSAEDSEAGTLALNIGGEDAGLLIGRRGDTLASLQFILNFVLSRKTEGKVNVALDVEGYRERRYEQLRSMALRMAERAVMSGRTVAMEPMPARERRIVHMALADHAKVTTESVGEGEERRVTINLKPGVARPMLPRQAPPPRRAGPPPSGGYPSRGGQAPGYAPRRPAPRYPPPPLTDPRRP